MGQNIPKAKNIKLIGNTQTKGVKKNSATPKNKNEVNKKTAPSKNDLLWLDTLAVKAGMPDLDLNNIGDNWIFLDQMENLLRNLTKLYREQGHIDPDTYEDFADRLQDLIDTLKLNLGIGSDFPINNSDHSQQLEIEFFLETMEGKS